MNQNTLALGIFVSAYALFVVLPNRRTIVAVAAGALLLLAGVISPGDAFRAINWNVMGIFVGTLVVADLFMESRVPARLAELIVDRAPNTAWAILAICALTGFISAFVENVATVLIVAPIALALAKKLAINPVKMMIAIAISSNLQGCATLIGDPPSMLLGGFAKMTFADFFFYRGRPGIFFAVELGAIVSFVVLYRIFRGYRRKAALIPVEKVRSWVPTLILVTLIAALALSSFFDTEFSYMAGALCMIAGVLAIAWDKLATRRSVIKGIRKLDWDTTFFLAGIFILVGSLTLTGWIDAIAGALSDLVGKNVFLGYTLIVFVSVAISAFVDNVPYLAAMLPVAMKMSDRLSMDPSLFLFGLLIGASLGGNITPIGASANIVACGMLRKEGYEVRFGEFMRIGIPFTLAAVVPAYLFIWWIWGPVHG
jgi:Na+/H+ antiporter NhaD/arsenite permease-like protein